jgi:hypothetical protein
MKHPLLRIARSAPLLGLGLALATPLAGAQAPTRDPMQPPPAARAPGPAGADGSGATAAPAAPAAPRQLMSVDGRRYVVEGTRRFAVGEMLGSARIERIDDSAVWVREGGTLQRLSVHGGVRRLPAPETLPAPAATPSTRPAPPRPTAKGAP